MTRAIALLTAAPLGLSAAAAQSSMQPTAPQKMMSPAEAKKRNACEQRAADQQVKMDERAKFIMNCMTGRI